MLSCSHRCGIIAAPPGQVSTAFPDTQSSTPKLPVPQHRPPATPVAVKGHRLTTPPCDTLSSKPSSARKASSWPEQNSLYIGEASLPISFLPRSYSVLLSPTQHTSHPVPHSWSWSQTLLANSFIYLHSFPAGICQSLWPLWNPPPLIKKFSDGWALETQVLNLAKNSSSISSTDCGTRLPVTPVPGDPMPSSGICGTRYVHDTDIHTCKTNIHIK